MSKQDAIKEAYEEVGLPFHENVLCNQGWMNIKPTQYQSKYDLVDIIKNTSHVWHIRPKYLQGIETNNLWTKIESEADLPRESGDYWTYEKNGSIGIRFFMSIPQTWGNHEMEVEEPNVTHYQPITKPLKPIY